ncbi:cell division protein SepF [Enemella dayhoffiae]|uniref:Cell division protein SepF n=1 Tax=Enemella dayhoffiae TaxID=2016507 RepID=A0A255HBG2_9ACTN|nr:cell division protein SepF [Enemella dayhoffiae]OYO24666.1 cell division protein SepF [Enemella dayhoffiae]
MAGRLRGAAEWLGLTTSERYDRSYDYDADVELTENVDRGTEDSASVHDLEHRRSQTRPAAPEAREAAPRPRTADISRIITVHPRTYNEARTIGEHFRDSVPVIMNLSEMEDADAKRLVDFAAGLIFGLRGTIERVTSKVFLLSPQNVNVTAEDKERIAGGFFNQS